MSKIINLKQPSKTVNETIFTFIHNTKNNLEEMKKELCRKYDNWDITQNEFNAAIIMSIRLENILQGIKDELKTIEKKEELKNEE